jgi:RHS repeat-associated protein
LRGDLLEETYPSTRVVKNTFDADGDLSKVESKKDASDYFRNYATSFFYTPSGEISSVRLGNGKFETTQYNNRLQPVQFGLGSSIGNPNLLKLDYDYGSSDNNGNVKSQTITVPTLGQNEGFTAVQTYTYDSLNRLQSATENIIGQSIPIWKQTFQYDRYGNRNFDAENTTTLGSCPASICNPSVNQLNNRLIGYVYDSAGNTKTDAESRTFIYDGENKQVEVKDANGATIGRYFYDGDGKRVKKITAAETTVFVYNASGRLVAEYSTQLSPQPQISYLTNDHLGSPRIKTNQNGVVTARHDYQPFGAEITSSQRISNLGYNSDDIRKKFTSYERDIETYLDFAQARMYNYSQGRFTAVDPLRESAKADNPQSWNRYSYTFNNPLNFVDPTGLIAMMDDYYVERDGNIIIKETEDSFDRFFVQDKNSPTFTQVAQLERNKAGLVQFPDTGGAFNRYGTIDAGGRSGGETVGQGDHFVQPVVAAALFGLTTVLSQDYGITLSLGDMSSSNGSDPWQKDFDHHAGHGHMGNRSGLDVDFRYVNEDGASFQSNTATTSPQFSPERNQTVFDTAQKFGFTENYQGTSGNLKGVTRAAKHNDHGHLGFNPAKAKVFTCYPGAGGICN